MPRRTAPPRPLASSATAEEGAAHVRAFMLELFARNDGEAVDWRLMTETLFVAAFDALDKLPDDICRKVASRAHEGSYNRMTDGPKRSPGASKTGVAGAELSLSNTADFKARDPSPSK